MSSLAMLNGQNGKSQGWELIGLAPIPEEEWRRLREFLGLSQTDFEAMLATVETLFKRGHELVVGNYEYLLKNHDTAAILGWEQGADPAHLAERRRFFTVWLARTLGLDFSDDFARYLFRAGQLHAGHGPRQAHVPELYVIGAISLVMATFAQFLAEDMPGSTLVPTALAGWNKVLSLHLHMMLAGYRAARALDSGDFSVKVSLFGKMRTVTGRHELGIHLPAGARMETVLQKFFNYFPHARPEVFEINWLSGERIDATGTPWLTTEKVYKIKPAWRVLLNGQDLNYSGGPSVTVAEGDEISIFPPGR
ncbi:MAG TPA: protoglobin domain-containing protein [Anaerolineae bacterium]|nr:protoglobin domain-containing protein [Anaerolineae bacterium]